MSDFAFDVAFSFAAEDRQYVEQVADALRSRDVRIFYDRYEESNLWGTDLYKHLSAIYFQRARYTVIFISRDYARKVWPTHERTAAQARAFAEHRDRILPARFDDAEVPGLLTTVAYINLKALDPKAFAELLFRKISSAPEATPVTEVGGGPLPQSEPKPEIEEQFPLPLLMYSVNTSLAFRLNEEFYRQVHYAWCAPHFDMRRNQYSGIGKVPASANPFEIYAGFLRDARAGDMHSRLIEGNREGLRRGAKIRYERGQIKAAVRNEINEIVDRAATSDYSPLIYVIPTAGVKSLLTKVDVKLRAHPLSREFIINDLPRNSFDIITVEDPLII